jgi:hypothetical protein
VGSTPLILGLVEQERSEPGWRRIGQSKSKDLAAVCTAVLKRDLGPEVDDVQEVAVLQVQSHDHNAMRLATRRRDDVNWFDYH